MILKAIADGNTQLSRITDALCMNDNAATKLYLDKLIEMRIVSKETTVQISSAIEKAIYFL